jgi:hypothetical protein
MPSIYRALFDYENPRSLGSFIRRQRSKFLREVLDAIHAEHGRVRVLDLGGRRAYWLAFGEDYLRERNVTVLLVNLPGEAGEVSPDDSMFTSYVGDALNLPASYGPFELIHSNSVIEHVGEWAAVEHFAKLTREKAPYYFLQTPYFWFPYEPHYTLPFFHWLPESWRAKILMRMDLPFYQRSKDMSEAMKQVRAARLLDRAQVRFLFPDAKLQFEWLGFLPKSLIAQRAPTR